MKLVIKIVNLLYIIFYKKSIYKFFYITFKYNDLKKTIKTFI